jgi:hypothetical protein
LYFCVTVYATPIRPLFPGNAVPGLELKNLLCFPQSAVRLHSLSSKLVLMDFMDTNFWSAPGVDSTSPTPGNIGLPVTVKQRNDTVILRQVLACTTVFMGLAACFGCPA